MNNNIGLLDGKLVASYGFNKNIHGQVLLNFSDDLEAIPEFGNIGPTGALYDFYGNSVNIGQSFSYHKAVVGFKVDKDGKIYTKTYYRIGQIAISGSQWTGMQVSANNSFEIVSGPLVNVLNHMTFESGVIKSVICGVCTSQLDTETVPAGVSFLVAAYQKDQEGKVTATYSWETRATIMENITQMNSVRAYLGQAATLIESLDSAEINQIKADLTELQGEITDVDNRVRSVEVTANSRYVSR